MHQDLIVTASIADLRREPVARREAEGKDCLQESQLLFGEHVTGLEELNGWWSVIASEQKTFVGESGWQGYRGWVKAEDLSPVRATPHTQTLVVTSPWTELRVQPSWQQRVPFGTKLSALDRQGDDYQVMMPSGAVASVAVDDIALLSDLLEESTLKSRQRIVDYARQFVGAPYLWGGLSPFDPCQESCFTSTDCSGLVYLIYRAAGVSIPRDAHDQSLASKPVDLTGLQAGDLVFSAEDWKAERMTHVMVYLGDGEVVEAKLSLGYIRQVTLADALNGSVSIEKRIPFQTVLWGSFLLE